MATRQGNFTRRPPDWLRAAFQLSDQEKPHVPERLATETINPVVDVAQGGWGFLDPSVQWRPAVASIAGVIVAGERVLVGYDAAAAADDPGKLNTISYTIQVWGWAVEFTSGGVTSEVDAVLKLVRPDITGAEIPAVEVTAAPGVREYEFGPMLMIIPTSQWQLVLEYPALEAGDTLAVAVMYQVVPFGTKPF